MAKNQDNVWPRPKKNEDDARVGKSGYKDYEHMKITDKKDGKNGDNLGG
jgi:hypothetical protein